jgi:predicted glycosyltransferase
MRTFSRSTDTIFTLTAYTESMQARRFLFYSHDGLGLGDVRRSLSIARELAELNPAASVLLVTGADEVESLGVPARVGILKLPGFQKRDDAATAGRLQIPQGEVRVLRERLLAATAETFQPEVVLVDGHPFGIGGELGPALEIARAFGAQAVLGLCDVIDDRGSVDVEWHARGVFERIAAYYSRVLVYGQPDVLDPVRDCSFPAEVAAITSFCGYVVSAARERTETLAPDDTPGSLKAARPRVLATVGGGADGFPVLEAFLEAASGARWRATVVAGHDCPPGRVRRLEALAAEVGVTFRHFVPSVMSEFSSLDALVCMGGYNTLAEAVASGVPTVCVPRVEPSREQLVRSEAFARRRLIRMVEPDRVAPDVLRTEIEAALISRGVRPRTKLDLGGGRRAAHHLMELASQRASRPRSKQSSAQMAVASTV